MGEVLGMRLPRRLEHQLFTDGAVLWAEHYSNWSLRKSQAAGVDFMRGVNC